MRRSPILAFGFFAGLTLASLFAIGAVSTGCSTPNDTARTEIDLPDEATFGPVASALVYRCGSVDCHGSQYRNFRLYGEYGRRADAGPDVDARPDYGPTTDAEVALDFAGFVGLEPEILSQVVADHGADPDRLTLVRKARGLEDHKGGQRIVVGDDADQCLIGWLASAPNPAACARVLTEF